MENIDELKSGILAAIANAGDLAALEAVRVAALGKKGTLSAQMQTLGSLPPEERKSFGATVNAAKDEVTAALAAREAILGDAALTQRLEAERVDVTLPVSLQAGTVHPITQTIDELIAIFADMGFKLAEGPDIEDDWHNFEALNIPPDHPARQMHDTFYLPDADGKTRVLRTHTSPVQIRTMIAEKPPIRVIAPGRTYRYENDQTHAPMFHQFELLVIDENVTMAHLHGTILEFCRTFFQIDDLPIRFRPSFFPFTEPSAEVDLGCDRKGGKLKLGNYGDWLELGGCGMVHPNVLKNCGIDPDRYQGFALGFGIDRIAMLKYGIPDVRSFFDSDIRWLKHYGFGALQQPSLATGL
jgi:phenylalanyl-tRNA synthetase alpha chain